MPQTIQEILQQQESFKEEVGALYQVISDDVENDPTLADVQSASKTADYKLWMYIFAAISWLQQQVINRFRGEIQAIADAAPTCNDRWFEREVRKFQFGDPLLFDNETKKYFYAEIDEDKQIVKRVAVQDQNGRGIIKAAKEVGGEPFALSTSELNALIAYVRRIQPFGSNIGIISAQADLLRLFLNVTYDGLVPLATLQANVQAAIMDHIKNIGFNGTLWFIRLQDAVQQVEGIIDVEPVQLQAAQAGGPFTNWNRRYLPVSGYLDIDPDNALADTIEYSAG